MRFLVGSQVADRRMSLEGIQFHTKPASRDLPQSGTSRED